MEKAKQLAIKANELRSNNQYEKALELYNQSWDLQKDGYTGAGLLHCLRKLKRFKQAIPFSKELLKMYFSIDWVQNEVAWTLIESLFKESKNFRETLENAKIIEKISSNTIILKMIGAKLSKYANNKEEWLITNEWLDKVEPEKLSTVFIKNTKWSDKSIWSHNKSKALLNMEENQELLSQIDKYIKDFPQIKEYFLRLKANALRNIQKYKESQEIYDELLSLKNDWWIYKNYADLLLLINKDEEALKMLYNAINLNKNLKMTVNLFFKIGKICVKLNRNEEAIHHFILSKLIREKEGWSITENLEKEIKKLKKEFPQIVEINSIDNIVSKCESYWGKYKLEKKISHKKSTNVKKFKGKINLGNEKQQFCFINTKTVSIICDKKILPSDIKNNDTVICETIPSFDKKKKKKSWKAIKVFKA